MGTAGCGITGRYLRRHRHGSCDEGGSRRCVSPSQHGRARSTRAAWPQSTSWASRARYRLDLTPERRRSALVLVHAGFAIQVVDEQFANESLESSSSRSTDRRRRRGASTSTGAGRHGPRPRLGATPSLARATSIDASDRDGEAADRPMKLMEVCGTHTVAIAKNGLRAVMPAERHAPLGPRMPGLRHRQPRHRPRHRARTQPGVIAHHVRRHDEGAGLLLLAAKEKADGRDIRIVYSPLDALTSPRESPTSTSSSSASASRRPCPLIAAAIQRAAGAGPRELHRAARCTRRCPSALEALVNDPEVADRRRSSSRATSPPSSARSPTSSSPTEYHVPGVIDRLRAGRRAPGRLHARQAARRGPRRDRDRATTAA